MLGYIVLGGIVTVYWGWTVVSASASPLSFRSGVVLSAAAILGFFAYFAMFRDTIHVSHTESEWSPNWLWYFLPGLGIPALVRFVLPSLPLFESESPLIIVYSLIFTTSVVCAVYLYRRWQYLPDPLNVERNGGS
jgi:hypothetical protein